MAAQQPANVDCTAAIGHALQYKSCLTHHAALLALQYVEVNTALLLCRLVML